MTPDWKDAPEWARWLAMDQDGEWHWFDNKPSLERGVWAVESGRTKFVEPKPIPRYAETLQERPQ